jgi:hypothetical protein
MKNIVENDTREKAWIQNNQLLFPNSGEHSDMFLTVYRIRNAYEVLLKKLEVGQTVTEERDLALVNRLFDMDFYPERRMSLSDWKKGRDPRVKILRAYKDDRWKKNHRRPHEITLELDNGKLYQINPNDSVSKFLQIRSTFESLANSDL